MNALLLVAWIVSNQPPSNYQTVFSTMELCQKARLAVTAEAKRLREEWAENSAQTARLVAELAAELVRTGMSAGEALNAAQNKYQVHLGPRPTVSAICVVQ